MSHLAAFFQNISTWLSEGCTYYLLHYWVRVLVASYHTSRLDQLFEDTIFYYTGTLRVNATWSKSIDTIDGRTFWMKSKKQFNLILLETF